MQTATAPSRWQRVWHGIAVLSTACVLTLACFLVLPLLQAIGQGPKPDLDVRSIDSTALPPPPPPVEEPPEQDKPPEEKLPELAEQAPPLDLAQLELALNPGTFGDGLGGAAVLEIKGLGGDGGGGVDSLFSLADLDQKPRAVHQPEPVLPPALRKKLTGTITVVVLFVVGADGRVETPVVERSSDPAFDQAVLAAVKSWKYEPGQRDGKPVRFRVRQPFKFEG
ncbi:MAG: energy transducer TonB [Planctomycetota bacterium]